MNEQNNRIRPNSGHWAEAKAIYDGNDSGWKIILVPRNSNYQTHMFFSEHGTPRIFKTSDSAIFWCKEIGLSNITLEFDSI